MEKTFHLTNRLHLTIATISGIGLTIGYEPKYREAILILGCFIFTLEFQKKSKSKKRK